MKQKTKINIAQYSIQIACVPYIAWVVQKLWGWFIIPLGAPEIGFWHGMGLLMILLWPAASAAVNLMPVPSGEQSEAEELQATKIAAIRGVTSSLVIPTLLILGGLLYSSLM